MPQTPDQQFTQKIKMDMQVSERASTVIEWRPISELDRSKDNTYLVRVENVGGSGVGKGWIEKAYYADDEGVWYEGNAHEDPYTGITFGRVERGPWKITAFANWPEFHAR